MRVGSTAISLWVTREKWCLRSWSDQCYIVARILDDKIMKICLKLTLYCRWGPQSSRIKYNVMLLPDNYDGMCLLVKFTPVKCIPLLITISMVDYIEHYLKEALDVYSWLMLCMHMSLRKICTVCKQNLDQDTNVPLFLQHTTFNHGYLPSTASVKQT